MIKVLILMPDSWDGCTFYRLKNFKRICDEYQLADVKFLDIKLEPEELMEVLKKADLYICRLSEMMVRLFDEFDLHKMNKPIILDIDDNYNDIDPFSSSYEALGTEEVRLNDGTWLWKDKKGNFDLKVNRDRIKKFEQVMKRVDAIITTTFNLREYALEYNKNVVVIPNAIDFNLFPQLSIKKDNEIRILYAGGSTHFSDLLEIRPALERIMNTNPNIHFYFLGQVYDGIIKNMPKDRVHKYGWINADGHGFRLICMNADIGICPLRDSSFNTYKSSVKFYEYSSAGMCTLAKNISPYKDDIVDGETGLLYDTLDEFESKLNILITDPIQRMMLKNNAFKYVKEQRNVIDIAKDWVKFLEGAVKAYEI